MLRGCLLLLLIFGAAAAANLVLLEDPALPARGILAGVLALLATLWFGSMQGLAIAMRPSAPDADGTLPSDGDAARLTGVVRVDGAPMRAPFSGRPCAFLEYRAYTAPRMSHVGAEQLVSFRGIAAARVSLEVGGRRVALDGLPRLARWPEEAFDRETVRAAAAAHLATTSWSVDHGPLHADLSTLGSMLEGEVPDSRRRDFISGIALEYLELQPGRTPAARLEQTLGVDRWQFGEQRVEPGALVTIVGTWRGPQRVDIGLSLQGAAHAIHPGGASALARRERVNALLFVVVFGVLTIGAYLLVHLDRGAHWRALIDWFRSAAS